MEYFFTLDPTTQYKWQKFLMLNSKFKRVGKTKQTKKQTEKEG